MGGRQLNHPEKDCNFKKQAKNEQAAAHHEGGAAVWMHLFFKVIKKPISGQFMACGNEFNSNSDTSVYSCRNTRYAARFFYNSAVRPRDIDNLLAKKSKNALESSTIIVKTNVFGRGSILVSRLIQKKSQTKNLVVNANC